MVHDSTTELPRSPRRQRRPPWERIAAGLAAGLVVLGVIGMALWERGGAGKREGQPAQAGPLAVTLDVRVWKREDRTKGLTLGDDGALPLREKDWMRIEATASRPAYLYLVNLDAEGKVWPLLPWRKRDWDRRGEEKRVKELYYPEDLNKDAAPLLRGPSGVEGVLLLARDEPLSAAENDRLRRLLTGPVKQGKFDPLRGAVWLGVGEERFSDARDRGRPAGEEAGEVADPVERVRRLVRTELRALAVAQRGVCYPFMDN